MMNLDDELLIKQYTELQNEKRELENAIQVLKSNAKAKQMSSLLKKQGLAETRHKQMKDLLAAYRLGGISISNVKDSRMTFLLDTSYKDRYFESFYVEVETGKNAEVIRHTLPYFIPITAIAQEYLESNINQFANKVHKFLCCYVRRRQQILETKEKFHQHFMKDIESTFACDYARIDFKFRSSTVVSVILTYGLEDDLPQKIDVYLKNNDPAIISWCKDLYKKKYMDVATQNLVDRLE